MSYFLRLIFLICISLVLAFAALTFNNPLLIVAVSLVLVARGFQKQGFIVSFWAGIIFSLLSRSGGVLDLGVFSAFLLLINLVLYSARKILLEHQLFDLLIAVGLLFFSSLVIFNRVFCFVSWFALAGFLFLFFYIHTLILPFKRRGYFKL